MLIFGRSPRPLVAAVVRDYRDYRCIDTLTDCTASTSPDHASPYARSWLSYPGNPATKKIACPSGLVNPHTVGTAMKH